MTKIRVYGDLAKFLKKRVFSAGVSSVAEAVRFLVANFPAVEQYISEGTYRICLADRDIDETEIVAPSGSQEIKIIPVIAGAGGVFKAIAGVVLIGLSFIPGFQFLGVIGAGLLLNGVAQLLTPVQKLSNTREDPGDPRKSYGFSSVQNTSRQGTPVPIVYGECWVGSVVISMGIDLDQQSSGGGMSTVQQVVSSKGK